MQENEESGGQTTLVGGTGSDVYQLKIIIEDHEKRLRKLENLSATEPHKLTKMVSIREYLLAKSPKSDVEKTFIIGYYIERKRGLESFNAKDLTDGFREAKETVPANVNLSALKNVQKGRFMEAGEKKDGLKAWTLTNSGMSYLESPRAT